jgi:hypothetical protein
MTSEAHEEPAGTDESNADQGSGDRPDSPEEATSPPGNPEVDEERVEEAEEDADRTAPY